MSLYELGTQRPRIADPARLFVAPGAHVLGNVSLGLDVSVWFGAVLRGDHDPLEIGDGSNVQDGAVIHTDPGLKVVVGEGCTIGHRAIVHGATIGRNSLIGMAAVILNRAVIGEDCLVGAGALVTEGKSFPSGQLIIGAPAKAVRPLTPEEIDGLRRSAESYMANGRRFAAGLRPLEG